MFFISGNTDTFKLSGGIETITDSGSGGNTFTVPVAGDGKLVFTNSVLDNQDTLDLSATLANTQWDGSASSLESYLHVQEVNGNTRLSVSNTPDGPQTSVAVFQHQNVALSTILAHSIT
jgi:hypothetical protein